MRLPGTLLGAAVAVAFQSAAIAHPCGDAPALSDPELARRVARMAETVRISAAAGHTFVDIVKTFYGDLAKDWPEAEGRTIAVALLQASCVAMTRNAAPGPLPWHVADKLAGLSLVIPDFHEAKALLARIAADEVRR